MAEPIEFYGSNSVLKPAPGQEGFVAPMPTWSNDTEVISCWKLTETELREVVATGEVWLSYFRFEGHAPPPLKLSGLPLMSLMDAATGLPITGYRSNGEHAISDAPAADEGEANAAG